MRAAKLAVLLLASLSLPARAATLLIAPDRELVRGAEAVVIATAEGSSGHWTANRWIETVTTMRVEEAIRGGVAAGERIGVAEPGGMAGTTGLAIAGSPRFAPGDRVLLLLDRWHDGFWTAKVMAAGVFRFEGGLLVRHDVCGWDTDGAPHRERLRDAEAFLRFVRAVANGGEPAADYFVERRAAANAVENDATPSITSYLLEQGGVGIRWNTFPTPQVFLSGGAQTGVNDGGTGAVRRGLAAWTDDAGSNIVYQYGGTTTARGGLNRTDGTNGILFNDPNDEIPGAFTGSGGGGAVLAIGGAWFGSATHVFRGETFFTIGEADLIVQNGITGAGLNGLGFDHVLAHELGHTLGFRHSNEPPPGGTSTSSALMNSSVSFNNDTTGATLQAWDREAAAAVYGSAAPPPCTPPSIATQPHSIDLTHAETVTLTVAATGDAPLTFQWYAGQSGNTATPIGGATGAALTVTPQVTTSYWVRVSNGCTPPADSSTATVTVAGCPAVQFTSQPAETTILQSRSATLAASATGGTISYQWFEGTSGATAHPLGGGPAIVVTPASTTSYWVRASNTCGAFADSATIVVNVTPCNAPRIVVPPSGGSVAIGDPFTLFADVDGSAPLALQWYRGAKGDTSSPLTGANQESVATPPLFAPASFWLRASNDCGTVDTEAVPVTVVASCQAPVITVPPRDAGVSAGSSARLSVAATGTSLLYRWYQGSVFDFTKPVGGSAPVLVTPAISAPTEFWVIVTNSCGSANSDTVTVAPVVMKRRAAGR